MFEKFGTGDIIILSILLLLYTDTYRLLFVFGTDKIFQKFLNRNLIKIVTLLANRYKKYRTSNESSSQKFVLNKTKKG
jgi:hypothetical protein